MASVVILSGGGIKSSVCAWRVAEGSDLVLVHLSFGQTASSAELNATGVLAGKLPGAKVVPLVLPHVGALQRGGESGVPPSGVAGVVGTSFGEGEGLSPVMLAGVAPMMLTVGVQVALRVGASTVVTGLTRTAEGAHLGLAPADPRRDRRREMLHGLNIGLDALLPAKTRVTIEAPLMELSSAEILQLAARLAVPLEECWTCAASSLATCGACPPCRARNQAFAQTGTVDPASAQTSRG